MDAEDLVVGCIPLRRGQELRVILRRYKGQEFLNCRIFEERPNGERVHTHKGWTISADHLPALVDLLVRICR